MSDELPEFDEQKVVLLHEVTGYNGYDFGGGWRIEREIVAHGIVGKREVPVPPDPDVAPRYRTTTREEPIYSERATYLVLTRPGAVKRLVAERDAASMRAIKAEGDAKKAKDALESSADEEKNAMRDIRDVRQDRDQLRASVQKMERHLAAIREAIGSHRFTEITAASDSEEIPF